MTHGELSDGCGRAITYLRISVTDRCNYRCVYCMPPEGVPARRHQDMLSAEDIARFVALAAREGVRRVRLSGGEPLVSRRIVPLIRQIRAIPGIEDIALTTNGALLPRMARELKDAGLDRVNISLDTLDAAQFSQITRLGRVEQALAGIDAALDAGLEPVKINTVVVRRLNQDVLGLARLSLDRPIHVRFIEYMPIGSGQELGESTRGGSQADGAPTQDSTCAARVPEPNAPCTPLAPEQWDASDIIPSAELRARISAEGEAAGIGALEPAGATAPQGAGPARYWRFPGSKGTVGFISAMSDHFCASCNRLRLTADGTLRPCLFSDAEYPVREALKSGDDAAALAAFHEALAHKPRQHDRIDGTRRFMSQIGG